MAFKVEWFDGASGLHRHFNFSFYQSDTSVEMFDTKLRKMFLKRCAINGLDPKELFVGNTIVVFSRHLLIKDYANEYTKDQVENDKQSTLILLYPDAHDQLGFVLDCLERGGYNLCRARSLKFTLTTAREFLDRFLIKGKDISTEIRRLTSYEDVPSVALEIVGPSAIRKWRHCVRPSVAFEDTNTEENELNFRGMYGSSNPTDAEWELQFIFNQKPINVQPDPPVKLTCGADVTCCVIKPHVLREGKAGRIIEEIQVRGFHVFGFQAFILTKKEVEDFYEIYKGIPNQDYHGLVRQGSSGRCLVLALSQGSGLKLTEEIPSVVEAFRKLCGPSDPEVCRVLYPDSLRAKYGGVTQEENAVHCSDLEEDGIMEVEYFFTLMQPYQSV